MLRRAYQFTKNKFFDRLTKMKAEKWFRIIMKYEEICVGNYYSLKKTITEQMVQKFADFSGDYNPVHMDDHYCREHGLEARIVHGMLVLSFLSALIGMYLPGEGTVWMSQNIDFISPARIDDTLDITGEVIDKTDSNALGLKIIKLKISIKNQFGSMIVKGNVKVTLK